MTSALMLSSWSRLRANRLGVGEVVAEQAVDGLRADLGQAAGHPAQQGEHVAAQAAGVGYLAGEHRPVAPYRGDDQLGPVTPAAVQDGPAGAGPVGHRLHGQPGVAGGLELGPGRVEQRGLQRLAAPPGLPAAVPGRGHAPWTLHAWLAKSPLL